MPITRSFFFQAEDGIRDLYVTGVQTCALPISLDVVQGWRSAVSRHKGQRYTLSRGLNALLNGVFSMDLQDNKSGRSEERRVGQESKSGWSGERRVGQQCRTRRRTDHLNS